eukprot:3043660-Alexandrium_andersonii.AAC.1
MRARVRARARAQVRGRVLLARGLAPLPCRVEASAATCSRCYGVQRAADKQHRMVSLNGLAPATRRNESSATLLAALAWPMPMA